MHAEAASHIDKYMCFVMKCGVRLYRLAHMSMNHAWFNSALVCVLNQGVGGRCICQLFKPVAQAGIHMRLLPWYCMYQSALWTGFYLVQLAYNHLSCNIPVHRCEVIICRDAGMHSKYVHCSCLESLPSAAMQPKISSMEEQSCRLIDTC